MGVQVNAPQSAGSPQDIRDRPTVLNDLKAFAEVRPRVSCTANGCQPCLDTSG
jgi:hypothetical protein